MLAENLQTDESFLQQLCETRDLRKRRETEVSTNSLKSEVCETLRCVLLFDKNDGAVQHCLSKDLVVENALERIYSDGTLTDPRKNDRLGEKGVTRSGGVSVVPSDEDD